MIVVMMVMILSSSFIIFSFKGWTCAISLDGWESFYSYEQAETVVLAAYLFPVDLAVVVDKLSW